MADMQKGIDVILKMNNQVLGGQLNATLTRSAKAVDITNKIDGEWGEYLTSIKSWRIDCSGAYVKSDRAFQLLQDAFMNNTHVSVEVKLDNMRYYGIALITDFPLNSNYDRTYKYTVRLLGDGELNTDDTTTAGD